MEVPHVPESAGIETREVDVRKLLPYAAGSVDRIYTEHFVEHLTRIEGGRFFAECARVMKSGAFIRISTPDLAAVIEAYCENALDRWSAVGFISATRAQLVNDSLTMWGHRFTYDFEELRMSLELAGMVDVKRRPHGDTVAPGMLTEGRPFCQDLIVEGRKP